MTPLGVLAAGAGVIALALVCLALGAVLGGIFVHLRHPVRKPDPSPGPMMEVDEAMGHALLADVVGVGEHLGPSWVRSHVDGMTDVALLKILLQASLLSLVSSPAVVRRVRSIADALIADKAWHLPAADRPEREP